MMRLGEPKVETLEAKRVVLLPEKRMLLVQETRLIPISPLTVTIATYALLICLKS